MGFYDTGDLARGVYVSGSYAYVADGWDGLRIIDVSNPTAPNEVGFYDTGHEAIGVYVSGSYAYVADGWDGLYIIRNDLISGITQENNTSIPDKFCLYQNYPNPFNPTTTIKYALPQTAQVELTIYNTLGQKVRTLVQQQQPAGQYQVQWDGRDDMGRTAGSGVYYYKLTAGNYVQMKKMVLIK